MCCHEKLHGTAYFFVAISMMCSFLELFFICYFVCLGEKDCEKAASSYSTFLLQLLSNVSVTSGRGASRSPPPSSKLGLKVVLATPLGVSVVVACLSKLIKSKAEGLSKTLADFSAEVAEVKDIAEPLDDVDTLALADATVSKEHAASFNRFVGAVTGQQH